MEEQVQIWPKGCLCLTHLFVQEVQSGWGGGEVVWSRWKEPSALESWWAAQNRASFLWAEVEAMASMGGWRVPVGGPDILDYVPRSLSNGSWFSNWKCTEMGNYIWELIFGGKVQKNLSQKMSELLPEISTLDETRSLREREMPVAEWSTCFSFSGKPQLYLFFHHFNHWCI